MRVRLTRLHGHSIHGWKESEMLDKKLDQIFKGLMLLMLNEIKNYTLCWKAKQLMKIIFGALLIY